MCKMTHQSEHICHWNLSDRLRLANHHSQMRHTNHSTTNFIQQFWIIAFLWTLTDWKRSGWSHISERGNIPNTWASPHICQTEEGRAFSLPVTGESCYPVPVWAHTRVNYAPVTEHIRVNNVPVKADITVNYIPVMCIIPASIAKVNATHKGDLLVNGHQLLMVRPHQNALAGDVVRVAQNLQQQGQTPVNSLKLSRFICTHRCDNPLRSTSTGL